MFVISKVIFTLGYSVTVSSYIGYVTYYFILLHIIFSIEVHKLSLTASSRKTGQKQTRLVIVLSLEKNTYCRHYYAIHFFTYFNKDLFLLLSNIFDYIL